MTEPEKPEVALALEESTDLPEPLPDSFQVQESCSTPEAAESATEAHEAAATTAEEKTLAQLLGPPAFRPAELVKKAPKAATTAEEKTLAQEESVFLLPESGGFQALKRLGSWDDQPQETPRLLVVAVAAEYGDDE